MDKCAKYFEIDISKDVFDVCDAQGYYHHFENNLSGFEALENLMEATGSYHQ